RSAAAFKSPAMRSMVGACRPCVSGPISASPESLTTTRLNRGFAAFVVIGPLLEPLIATYVAAPSSVRPSYAIKKAAPRGPLGEFAGPSGLFRRLLDAFAQRVSDKAGDGDRRPDCFLGLFDRLTDSLGGIVNISLIEETDLLIERLQAGFDNLVEHVGGLAGVLLGEHRAFARDRRRIEPGGIESD